MLSGIKKKIISFENGGALTATYQFARTGGKGLRTGEGETSGKSRLRCPSLGQLKKGGPHGNRQEGLEVERKETNFSPRGCFLIKEEDSHVEGLEITGGEKGSGRCQKRPRRSLVRQGYGQLVADKSKPVTREKKRLGVNVLHAVSTGKGLIFHGLEAKKKF